MGVTRVLICDDHAVVRAGLRLILEARPGFVLVDRTGVVRMALLGQSLPLDETARLVRYALTGE